ncbi:F-box/FBD/LRR-repeat protein At1g13570-like isoform X1 [Actinidia eriantha]|uniref:F-box/FBD/LRR-repeat protein At1g13570-like isoform X1 n=2 Tax=Actinidia eriantha TaxID=165200 RepID=UPI002588B9B4|nr:F-box/FBD/LRR-repeat protein At1g13570-like isoform X1 [Actinidia eriantha]XP_057503194.1 F-box/FBD/LRR-repeat protein At1g13570-like isoform X1 [Actinidia eriantha]
MKPREPPKVPCEMEMQVDRISNLPGHIVDKIMSQLSLRDAVRTSVLSSKWRYKWNNLPNLMFDNQSIVVSSQDQTSIKNKLVNIVDHVLLLHTGPIHKFKLSHRDIQGVNDIDRWILYLSRGSVKEFILEIWKGHRYKLPSSLYSCQKLIHLELFNCLVKPPPTVNGFGSLKSIDLQHITMDQDRFEHLISSCTMLERLTLMNFDGFTVLNINAPNLQFFDIGGVFDDVNFRNTFRLAIVSIGLYVNIGYDQNLTLGHTGNLIKFFSQLPSIQRLEVQSYFLKYLAVGHTPGKLPSPCMELNYLSIRINMNDTDENLAALCLLRSSPNLQELEILARPEEQMFPERVKNIWLEEYYDCPFNQLRLVKVAGIFGVRCEMDFINFLLANSPVLERMTVKPASNDRGWELLKELVRFRRASVRAEIIYLDP